MEGASGRREEGRGRWRYAEGERTYVAIATHVVWQRCDKCWLARNYGQDISNVDGDCGDDSLMRKSWQRESGNRVSGKQLVSEGPLAGF